MPVRGVSFFKNSIGNRRLSAGYEVESKAIATASKPYNITRYTEAPIFGFRGRNDLSRIQPNLMTESHRQKLSSLGFAAIAPIEPLLDIDLDRGETDCINLGMSHADEVLLIIDERAGRDVAKEKGSVLSVLRQLSGRPKNKA
jgi:hypothetical protein